MKKIIITFAIATSLSLVGCANGPKPCSNDFAMGFSSKPCGEKRPVNMPF